ncbi:MAG: polyphosphate kinase 1 [Acidimicrobiia bacterium]|nr:polyphosphate kinase 1 [Acidimicrobiia bacterium]
MERPSAISTVQSDLYINREISWLGFNARVMALAAGDHVPLLERVYFLSIWASNLDEFFQVRVSGLKQQVSAGLKRTPPDGLTPIEQLQEIKVLVDEQYAEASRIFNKEIAPALADESIALVDYDTLVAKDRTFLDEQFHERVFPVVTPLAVDPAHPFPYISNLSLNLAVLVRDPDTGVSKFARVKVPPILDRFVVLPDGRRFVPLEQIIAEHLDLLFPGMEILGHDVFRVTRNADFEIEDDEASDLLVAIESELTRRRFGAVVRLEIHPEMSDEVLDLLQREMGIGDEDVVTVDGPLDLSGLSALASIDRDDLHYPKWTWTVPPRLHSRDGERPDIFSVIREGDLLVHFPYDSYSATVEDFVGRAARDPDVLAIKLTLYRTSKDSPILKSLIAAAEARKQVVVLVELKARFDEERNIEWAQRLEEAGVHVLYGVVGLKTHTKIALVVRDEKGAIQRYGYVGTGNFNDTTARTYEDMGLLTASQRIGADLSDLFNYLTGYSRQTHYRELAVSPNGIRRRILDLIRLESETGNGQITMKMNSLVDAGMIEALYEASQAGVEIDLIVRGTCCLRPGVPGFSENIRVRSIVGRYLEHSRIYRFGRAGAERSYLIGSADLMPRNLDRRVEALTPITDPRLRGRLDETLEVLLADDELAWELDSNGTWTRVPIETGVNAHVSLQGLADARGRWK